MTEVSPMPPPTPAMAPPPSAPALPANVLSAHANSMAWATREARALADGNDATSTSAAATTAATSSGAQVAPIPPHSASLPLAPAAVAGLRISQLDALALDGELGWLLGAQLRRACKYLSGGGWVSDHKAECEFILHATMFAATIARDKPTPGMKLQNLQFQNYAAMHVASGAARQGLFGRWGELLARWLGGAAANILAPTDLSGAGSGDAQQLNKLRMLLPAAHASSSGVSGAARAALSSIPLSNFAPVSGAQADSAASVLAAAHDGSSPVAAGVPSAVLLSSLPSTAPVGLSRVQKSLYFIASILFRYAWAKLNHKMMMEGWGGFPESDWHRKVYKVCRRIEQVYQAMNILNFIAFLHNGRYRTLLERALNLRMLYVRSRVARQVSFEFMNQQLAWGALSDFMLFLLPLIDFGRIGRMGSWVGKMLGLGGAAAQAAAPGADGAVVSLTAAVEAGCPVCGLAPACQPQVATPCGHVFCYYCLSANRLAEQQQARGASSFFQCPSCQQYITSQAPLKMQVRAEGAAAAAR